jgi:hypothetical protein
MRSGNRALPKRLRNCSIVSWTLKTRLSKHKDVAEWLQNSPNAVLTLYWSRGHKRKLSNFDRGEWRFFAASPVRSLVRGTENGKGLHCVGSTATEDFL